MLGPLTCILDMAEEARSKNIRVNVDLLRCWAQCAICMLGNVNASLITERRKVVLMRINPKLADMSTREDMGDPKGLSCGESFAKSLRKYVSTFTAFSKAQTNMRRVFGSRAVFGRTDRRGLAVSRGSFRYQYYTQDARNYKVTIGVPPQQKFVPSEREKFKIPW